MYSTKAFVSAVTLVALSLSVQNVYGQVVPYKSGGVNAVYSPQTGDFSGFGLATHLGKNSFQGNVAAAPTGQLTAAFKSTTQTVVVGASGDQLHLKLLGEVQFVPLYNSASGPVFSAVWSGQAVVLGGTGRFANVKPGPQALTLYAVNDPFTFKDEQWTFSWRIAGMIRLR